MNGRNGNGRATRRAGTAVILCGGKSSRAGFDKQLLPSDGTTLPNAIARKLRALFPEIIIVTGTPGRYSGGGFVVVEDIVKDAGPLAGILTGLSYASSEYAYVTAGDMPYPDLRYIEWMTGLLDDGPVIAIAASDGRGHLEPFNSIFAARCAPLMAAALAAGERSICRFLRCAGGVRLVAEEDARRFSPEWSMFASVNTRADVERYLARQPVPCPACCPT